MTPVTGDVRWEGPFPLTIGFLSRSIVTAVKFPIEGCRFQENNRTTFRQNYKMLRMSVSDGQ
jgi:hypothetical protein